MAINVNKFTLKSQEALQTAQQIAENYSNQIIEPEHLFAAIVQDTEGTVIAILQKLGISKEEIQIKAGEFLESLPKVSGAGSGNLSISRDLNSVLENAQAEALAMKDD